MAEAECRGHGSKEEVKFVVVERPFSNRKPERSARRFVQGGLVGDLGLLESFVSQSGTELATSHPVRDL